MQRDEDSSGRTDSPLRAALLDFRTSPGRYHVGLKQPPILFSSIREVLQIAVGRTADDELTDAARFFTRTALLHPAADHYTLLGLDRSVDAAGVKDRYRLMMRLLHPDFTASEPGVWPATAPVRVNLAYQVLSSRLQRREYDASLTAPPGRLPSGPDKTFYAPVQQPRHHALRPPSPRKGLRTIVAVCGLSGATLLVIVLLWDGNRDMIQLVQHAPARLAAAAMPPMAPQEAGLPASRPAPAPAMETVLPAAIASAPATTMVAAASAAEPPGQPPEAAPAAAPHPAVISPAPPPIPAPVPLSLGSSAPPPAESAPLSGITLAEAQPLLASLLQQVESGRGDRLLNLLDREARSAPAAQALSRQLDGMGEDGRPLKISQVQFRAQPADGRLYVIGHMLLHPDGSEGGATGKKLSLRVEFMSRGGTVVMTSLSGI